MWTIKSNGRFVTKMCLFIYTEYKRPSVQYSQRVSVGESKSATSGGAHTAVTVSLKGTAAETCVWIKRYVPL